MNIAAAVPIRGEAMELYVSGISESISYLPEVFINGKTAEILYSGPGQINIRIPEPLRNNETWTLQFQLFGRYSNSFTVKRN